MILSSFPKPLNAVVVGASGGIGGAFVDALLSSSQVASVVALSRFGHVTQTDERVCGLSLDLNDLQAIEGLTETLAGKAPFHLVIIASGLLHRADPKMMPEKSLNALNFSALQDSFTVNAAGPLLVAKALLPLCAKDQKSVFAALSARVGSISDNHLGGWYSYRMSKAALHMGIKTLSIEIARTHPHMIAVSLHPGTVDTALSKPFQSSHRSLLTPWASAQSLLGVMNTLTPLQSGGIYDYKGQEILP